MLIPSNNCFQANFHELYYFPVNIVGIMLFVTINSENLGKLARKTHKNLVNRAAVLRL